MIFKGTSTRSDANSYLCRRFVKKLVIGDKTKPLGFQKVGHESRQLGVTWLVIL
jgi:hypothetical protein